MGVLQGRLFPAGPAGLSTREVAELVRRGGVDALPAASRRGDGVRYQEVVCRSALNRVEGMPFRWTLNPYRGCAHGCHYCFARRYQAHLELGPGDDFASVVLVKTNFPDVLRRELARPSWSPELVALGTATDPYQPIEGHYRLTRATLAALVEGRTPATVVTKGPLAVRDADLLSELARTAGCTVVFSVPTVDDDVWPVLEPGTAPPAQRLRAARRLADAGLQVGVLVAPVIPGLTTARDRLARTFAAIADHGVAFVGASLLHLQGGTREHFLDFLARTFPHLVARYERLYAGKYAPKAYADQVHALVAALERRYGSARLSRPLADPGWRGPAPEVQADLVWEHEDRPSRP